MRRASLVEDIREEVTVASTASPSPAPQPHTSKLEQYFRFEGPTTLSAPVNEEKMARQAAARTCRLPKPARSLSFDGSCISSWGSGGPGSNEEKAPIPDNLSAWARYGFLDYSLIPEMMSPTVNGDGREAAASGGDREKQTRGNGQGKKSSQSLGAMETRQGESCGQESRLRNNGGGRKRDRRRHSDGHSSATSSDTATNNTVSRASARERRRPRAGEENEGLSVEVEVDEQGTLSTDVLTLSCEEGRRKKGAEALNAPNGAAHISSSDFGRGVAPQSLDDDDERRATALAASFHAAFTAAPGGNGELGGGGGREEEEEEERQRQERQRQQRQEEALRAALAAESASAAAAAAAAARDSVRPPQTIREIEQHKRIRAVRRRSYGGQRPLVHPRSNSNRFGPDLDSEDAETVEWIDGLRVHAALLGESLMSATNAKAVVTEHRMATLPTEQQRLEARASRTADLSGMGGSDGLLHCAVLRGDHALAVRAAQFLVDIRGGNVNSTDEWGRTPLHTAAGKGMLDMVRFFVRRGADVNALDGDMRTPLFFACATGRVKMTRFLTRIELETRYDLMDARGHLAGEYFLDSVKAETREKILAILMAAGWPNPPPPKSPREKSLNGSRGAKSSTGRAGARSMSRFGGGPGGRGGGGGGAKAPPADGGAVEGGGGGGYRSHRRRSASTSRVRTNHEQRYVSGEGVEARAKRLANDVNFLMKRR